MNKMITAKTANEAWETWFMELKAQAENGESATSRDGAVCGEVINAITVIEDPTRNVITSPIRKMPMRYAIGELLWYLSGNNSLKQIQNFTSAWDRMSDDGETVNSNYGHKIFDFYDFNQWEYVKTLLRNDPNSRQAVIHIKNPSNQKTKDMPCTVCLQYFIRDAKLHATTYMRSNDIWLGFPYDVFAFTCFQIKLAMELDVGIGSYTHISGSLHLYERNLPKEGENNEASKG